MNSISNAGTYTATVHKDVTNMSRLFFNRSELVNWRLYYV